jgi:hypothetical protein
MLLKQRWYYCIAYFFNSFSFNQKLISEFPGLKHIQYDSVSYSGMLLANDACGFGKNIPAYDFGAAKVIVSLDADFWVPGLVRLSLPQLMPGKEKLMRRIHP